MSKFENQNNSLKATIQALVGGSYSIVSAKNVKDELRELDKDLEQKVTEEELEEEIKAVEAKIIETTDLLRQLEKNQGEPKVVLEMLNCLEVDSAYLYELKSALVN